MILLLIRYVLNTFSHKFLLQIINLLHFFEELLLAIVFALHPLFSQDFAVGNGLTKGERIDEGVFEYSWVGSDAGYEICIVFLAKISEFIRNV